MPSLFSQPSLPHLRSQSRLTRTVATTGLVLSLAVTGACELRIGEGSPAALPESSVSEVTRDGLARQCSLLASTARVVSVSDEKKAVVRLAANVDTQADLYSTALGGVWDPWPTSAPTDYPTVEPVPTAASDATKEDLLESLLEGIALSTDAALAATDEDSVRLYASMTISWSLSARELDSESVEFAGHDATNLTSPLDGDTLLAYDAARYALEEVAARTDTDSTEHKRAVSNIADLQALINASLAAGSEDTRLSAYAEPTTPADSSTSLDITWARQVWVDIMNAELQAMVNAEPDSEQRAEALNAAVLAARRAQVWDADLGELPGYQSE